MSRAGAGASMMGSGNGGLAKVAGLASSSHVAEGRGTEVASKETRLCGEERRGREALPDLVEVEEVEERDEARGRDDSISVWEFSFE